MYLCCCLFQRQRIVEVSQQFNNQMVKSFLFRIARIDIESKECKSTESRLKADWIRKWTEHCPSIYDWQHKAYNLIIKQFTESNESNEPIEIMQGNMPISRQSLHSSIPLSFYIQYHLFFPFPPFLRCWFAFQKSLMDPCINLIYKCNQCLREIDGTCYKTYSVFECLWI